MNTASTTATALPLPYNPGGAPWAADKTTSRVRGFLRNFLDLGLPLPDDVSDALAAHRRLIEWAGTPRPDADAARSGYRAALLDAATNPKGKPPNVAPVIEALTRADADKAIARDTAAVSEQLHAALMGTVVAGLTEMTDRTATEHARILGEIRAETDRLPASVRTADAAVAGGPDTAAAWRALTDLGAQIMRVRDTRLRAAHLDGTRHSADYALYRHPEKFPKDAVAPTIDALRAVELVTDPNGAEPWCPTRTQLAEHVEHERAATARRRQGPESRMGQYKVAAGWAQP